MQAYVLRRLIYMVPTLLLGTVLVFAVMRVLPGDVAELIVGQEAAESGTERDTARLAELRQFLGLNDPLHVQYGKWLWSMVNGEFGGETLRTRELVRDELAFRLPKTAQLGAMAFAISVAMGIPLGVIAAIYQDKWPDYLIRLILVGGLSIPSFWLALMMLLGLLLLFRYTPPIAYVGPTEDFGGNMQIMIMPAFILGFHSATTKARVMRAQILEVTRQDYIRTARAKGLMERVILWRHAMKNALIPVVTIMGLQLLTLISGTVILETIFGIPGMGQGLVEAVRYRDYPLVQSFVTMYLAAAMAANLLTDLSYAWLDPRIKYH
jgi:peptide/nickel transport system permease protein